MWLIYLGENWCVKNFEPQMFQFQYIFVYIIVLCKIGIATNQSACLREKRFVLSTHFSEFEIGDKNDEDSKVFRGSYESHNTLTRTMLHFKWMVLSSELIRFVQANVRSVNIRFDTLISSIKHQYFCTPFCVRFYILLRIIVGIHPFSI